jgi:hypothetical protein
MVPPPPTLEQLLHDSRTHTFFLDYLQRKQAEVLLMFWSDCEQFKQLMGKTNEIGSQAKKIIDIHFGPQARTASMIGEIESNRVLDQFTKGRPTLDMFANAQRECVRQLRSNHFPSFLESKSYKEMLQANVDIKNWTLQDTFRDPKRVRALHLLLQVERPDFVETLRFTLDLRNRYKPLIAEGLLPVNEGTGSGSAKGIQSSGKPQKLHIVKELIDLGKFLEKKYLSADSKQFAKGVSGPTAARVRQSLEDCSHKLEAATLAANQHLNVTVAKQATAARTWVTNGVGAGQAPAGSQISAPSQGPSSLVLDDTIKFLADAFKQAEEEAVGWLERFAIADARRTDYFLSPIMETPSPNKPLYAEDVPSQDSILVLRMSNQEIQWRLLGPHKPQDRDLVSQVTLRRHPLTHLLQLETKLIGKGKEDTFSQHAADSTGATISGISKGIKFRTKLAQQYTYPNGDSEVLANTVSTNTGEDEQVIQQTAKVTSLAGVSQQESVVENMARSRAQYGFDSKTLSNTELHAHCFPLHLGIEVDTMAFTNENDILQFYHYFCLPCKSSKHSFEYDCQCVFGCCLTKVTRKSMLTPISSSQSVGNNAADLSTMSVESTGSFSVSRNRGRSPRNLHYSETALSLQKVPNFGLGLNLALNRDGSVVVTRFVSDVQTPSPAAASGKIAVEDELLAVNRVSVHGRRFDDIVGQIKNSASPVYLRFARGNYLESIINKAFVSTSPNEPERIVKVANPEAPEGEEEEMIKLTVYSPEVTCITSNQPIFNEMRIAMEEGVGPMLQKKESAMDVESIEEQATHLSAVLLSSSSFANKISWSVDVRASLFNFLDVPRVVDIIAAMLLERRVLIISDYPERIAPAVVALMQIIRPFSWRHDFSPFLPEPHYDWFTSKIGSTKPFLVGLCTVDVVPPPVDQFIPRRQGRLTLREDIWSTRERDFMFPTDRLIRNAGYVRNAVTLLTTQDTLIVDLDSDKVSSGNSNIFEKDRFPADIRDSLIADINAALGRGGLCRLEKVMEYDDVVNTPGMATEQVNKAFVKAYNTLTLNRCGEFCLSLKEGIVGFYRGAFLGAVKTDSHQEFLEKFTKTETFKEYVISNWDIAMAV